ncbi:MULTISPECIES: PilZ domain-containing protein [Alkalimonas]|uniref:PilZ domain-containing protein n=1 Tax=Alkalimonas mucilaginosa TaxID=3057676 RepID=A0ABU7JEX7_9GAMM|nr:PilZ domain-containing protein [Alkalimonas sp. MEB004]MEE2024050.1 PilZ domain-containing protein [Alkalimonas sp. MEB004]
MPITKTDVSRKYLRWYFCAANQPHEVQTKGVPVTLWQSSLFGSQICKAVVKDMSLGGVGLLAPLSKNVPDVILVQYDERIRMAAEVVYRRQVSDKLVFLGLSWLDAKREQRLKLLRLLSKKAYRLSQDSARTTQKTADE